MKNVPLYFTPLFAMLYELLHTYFSGRRFYLMRVFLSPFYSLTMFALLS